MSKVSSSSVQPVAKAASHATETPGHKEHEDVLMDAMGFATRVEFILDGRAQSVRNRLPPHTPGTDQFASTRKTLEKLLGKGGTAPTSVGSIAHDALKYLAAAEKNLAQLPKEYQEIGRRILNSAWQAATHGTEAILRERNLGAVEKKRKIDQSRPKKKPRHEKDPDEVLLMQRIEELSREVHSNGRAKYLRKQAVPIAIQEKLERKGEYTQEYAASKEFEKDVSRTTRRFSGYMKGRPPLPKR